MYPFREEEDQDLAPAAALQNMFHRILSARSVWPLILRSSPTLQQQQQQLSRSSRARPGFDLGVLSCTR